jgi:hypothetical protein
MMVLGGVIPGNSRERCDDRFPGRVFIFCLAYYSTRFAQG